jgi:hypothetical protein
MGLAQRDGRCAKCGRPIYAGERVLYRAMQSRVLCARCAGYSADSVRPSASEDAEDAKRVARAEARKDDLAAQRAAVDEALAKRERRRQ